MSNSEAAARLRPEALVRGRAQPRRRPLPGRPAVLTGVLLLWVLAPVLWLLSLSFKNQIDAVAMPPLLVFAPTLRNYQELLQQQFTQPFLNSIVISISTTALSLVLGVPAAYALGKMSGRGGALLGFWILSTRMAPAIAFAIPIFLAYRTIGWLDTLQGLIVIHLTFNLSLVIWLMRTFFDSVPRSLEEAASIDGASRWQTFSRIVLPLVAPGLATAAIFSFLTAWNDFFYSLVLSRRNAIPVTVAIANAMNYYGWDWGRITAGSIVVTTPVVVFSLLLRRYLIRGLTAGAVKG